MRNPHFLYKHFAIKISLICKDISENKKSNLKQILPTPRYLAGVLVYVFGPFWNIYKFENDQVFDNPLK